MARRFKLSDNLRARDSLIEPSSETESENEELLTVTTDISIHKELSPFQRAKQGNEDVFLAADAYPVKYYIN